MKVKSDGGRALVAHVYSVILATQEAKIRRIVVQS
jgi:hypothetical protein